MVCRSAVRVPINDPQTRIRGYEESKVISHHVHLRPTLDGSRVVDVTMDMTPDQLTAGSHAVRTVVADRYRVATLESADDILAMRELTSLADELQSLVVPGAIARLTLNVGGIGRFSEALEAFVRVVSDDERPEREGDADAVPHVYAIIDGVADAHRDAMRVALDDSLVHRG
jgi:hypothetical protein